MSEPQRTGGIWSWLRPTRHRPADKTATADTAQGERTRAHLPGPPGDVHTARIATDTWGADPSRVYPRHPDADPTGSGGEQGDMSDSG